VHQVSGVVNPDCTLQGGPPPTIVVSKVLVPGSCELVFPHPEFTDVPVLQLTPITGSPIDAAPVSVVQFENGEGNWVADYAFLEPTLVNFLAVQITR
jgi:hypothetical protein